ncbi:hypothetical protein EYF80_066906 [Liparis tanakae]|uniref:Uncharacterized protein n=1 Tax=Liparis tanakae TaxID=230148 RepID=A0A4Z2E2K9_9TELE|nr:hypothetical protein EYF80_066906 [Liparis tanakae]
MIISSGSSPGPGVSAPEALEEEQLVVSHGKRPVAAVHFLLPPLGVLLRRPSVGSRGRQVGDGPFEDGDRTLVSAHTCRPAVKM